MSIKKNATNTPSPYYQEMVQWADENIPHVPGFYILHFDDEIGNQNNSLGLAGHYSGYADNLHTRFLQHLGGCGENGARLTEVLNERGIKYHMVSAFQTETEELAFAYETYFKKSIKNSKRHCPQCGQLPLPTPRASTLEKYKSLTVA